MKRAFVSVLVAAGIGLSAVPHSAAAAEVDAQDVLILKQTVESQQETLDGLKRRLAAIESLLAESRREADGLRRANAAMSKDLVTQEQLRVLASKVEQVDNNRANDSKRIFETLKKFAEIPPPPAPVSPGPAIANPPARHSTRPPVDPSGAGSKPENEVKPPKPAIELPADSYQHLVKPGETLSEILIAYRKEYGLKTTMAHVEAANPGLNPKKLKVDQKINIPLVK